MDELQRFGLELHQSLHGLSSDDLEDLAVVAYTFGGKVVMTRFANMSASADAPQRGFSEPFVSHLRAIFKLDMISNVDISVATTWKVPSFEPFVEERYLQLLTGEDQVSVYHMVVGGSFLPKL